MVHLILRPIQTPQLGTVLLPDSLRMSEAPGVALPLQVVGKRQEPARAAKRRRKSRIQNQRPTMMMTSIPSRRTMKRKRLQLPKLSRQKAQKSRRRRKHHPSPNPSSSGKSSPGERRLTSTYSPRRFLKKSRWMASNGRLSIRKNLLLLEYLRSLLELPLRTIKYRLMKSKRRSKPLTNSFNQSI